MTKFKIIRWKLKKMKLKKYKRLLKETNNQSSSSTFKEFAGQSLRNN